LRLHIAAIAALAIAAGCAGDRGVNEVKSQQMSVVTETAEPSQASEPSKETFALGSAVTAAGAVPQDAASETFIHGGPIYLSINVESASRDQKVEVHWIAPDGSALRSEERAVPRSANYVAFTTGATAAWPTGEHRAVVMIDGRKVSEKPFTLQSA
jgi:hypothetical protein